MKTCNNCGAQLPDSAAFCPACEAELVEKAPVPRPRLWRRKALAAGLVLLLLAGCAGAAYLLRRPAVFTGGAAVTYTDRDGAYDLVLSYDPPPAGERARPQTGRTIQIPAGERWGTFTCLCVYPEGSATPAGDAFLQKVERCTLTAEAVPPALPMEASAPEVMERKPFATQAAAVYFTADSGTNTLRWTLEMKNGDTIILSHQLTVAEQQG